MHTRSEIDAALEALAPDQRRAFAPWLRARWHLARSEHVEAYEVLGPFVQSLKVQAANGNLPAEEAVFGAYDTYVEACFLLTNYVEAHRYARAFLEHARRAGALRQLGIALSWLGAAQTQQGYYQEGMSSLLRAIETLESNEMVAETSRAHNARGIIFEENGEFAQAYECYSRAHDLAVQDGHRDMEGRALANWGDALVADAKFDEGLKRLAQAIDVLEGIGAYWHSGWCELAVGKAYAANGRMDDALTMHKCALASVRKCAAPRIESEVLAGLGELHGKMGNYELARMQLEYALATATRAGIEREIFKIHLMLARVHKQFGNFERALHHHEQFHAVRTKVYDELSRAKLAQIVDEQEFERLSREQIQSAARAAELQAALDEVKALNVQLREKAAELEYLSNQDPLTGLYNRRYLYARVNAELGRADRHGSALSIVLYDVDNFKWVNDRFSHEIGDDVLRHMTSTVSANLRQSDVHVRYGGEEFAILMPETDPEAALYVAEKLRTTVAGIDWTQIAPGLAVTISAGVVSMQPGESMAAVLRRVDAKLFEAKRGGRDRVVQG